MGSTTDFSRLSPTATVKDAAILMRDERASAVLVTEDDGSLVGIFTERDLLARVINKNYDPATTLLSSVMTRDPDTVQVGTKPSTALARMHRGQYRHLPVVDEHHHAVQLLDILTMTYGSIVKGDEQEGADTSTGWLRWRFRHAFGFFKSKQIKLQDDLSCALSEDVAKICLAQSVTVREAVAHMAPARLTAILSLDNDDVMNGIFTERDLVTRVVAKGLDPEKTLLSAVMTRNPECVSPRTPPMKALELMHEKRFRHLPVIDDAYIVGILDILKLTYDSLGKNDDASETLTSRIGNLLATVAASDFAHLDESSEDSFVSTESGNVGDMTSPKKEEEEQEEQVVEKESVTESIDDVYFKYKFAGKMYRVCLTEKSLDTLIDKISSRINVKSINLEYIDDDGDAIELCDDEALDDAIKLFQRLKWNVIRLNVSAGDVEAENETQADSAEIVAKLEQEGNAHVQSSQYDEAIESYTEAIKHLTTRGMPQDTAELAQLVRVYFRRASVKSITGVQHGGLGDFRDVISISKKHPSIVSAEKLDAAYLGICEVYTETGQYEAAVEALKEITSESVHAEAIAQMDDELSTLRQSGTELLRLRKYAQAAATLSQAIRISTGVSSVDSKRTVDPAIYTSRAEAYIGLDDCDHALADCKSAMTINPSFAPAYVAKGKTFTLIGSHDAAIKAYKQGMSACADHSELSILLAKAEHAAQRGDKENNNSGRSEVVSASGKGGDVNAIRNLGAMLSAMNTQ